MNTAILPGPLKRTSNDVKTSDVLTDKEFWILFLASLLYFSQPLFFNQTFFYRDLFLHFYPQKQRFVELVFAGKSLLWDPYIHGGQPFLADVNNLVLYPTNLLYLLLPLTFAFNLDIAGHVIFAALGTYVLARMLGLIPAACFISGAVYGFCGYTLSLTNLMNHLLALCHLPWLLLMWDRFLRTGRKLPLAGCVMAGGFQVFAGAPEISLLSFLILLCWSFIDAPPRGLVRRFALWCVVLLFVAAVSAIQILPTAEMVAQSSRSSGPVDFWFTAGWPLPPKRVPEFVIPSFLGETRELSAGTYWGSRIEDLGFPYILGIYFGAVSLVYAVSAGLAGAQEYALSRRKRRFLFVFMLLCVLLSFGRFLPFFKPLQEAGVFGFFRYTIKFLTGAILPVALLAGCCLDRHCREGFGKTFLTVFWCIAGLLLVWTAAFQFSPGLAAWFSTTYFDFSHSAVRTGLTQSFFHAAAFSLVGALLYHLSHVRGSTKALQVIGYVVLADLLFAGRALIHYAPADFFESEPQVAKTVREHLGDGRLYRAPSPRDMVYRFPESDTIYFDRWRLETLANYTAPLYNIPVIFHDDYDRLAPARTAALSIFVYKASWEQRLPVLSASGVRLILTADDINLNGVERIAGVRNASNKVFHLYRNLKVAPRANFITDIIPVTTDQAALREMTNKEFDATTKAVIVNPPLVERIACDAQKASIEPVSEFNYNIDSRCDGYVVFSEPYYPGWKIFIDGKPAEPLKANMAFTAVPIDAGSHRVERSYRPLSVQAGVIVSVVGLIGLLLFPVQRLSRVPD